MKIRQHKAGIVILFVSLLIISSLVPASAFAAQPGQGTEPIVDDVSDAVIPTHATLMKR